MAVKVFEENYARSNYIEATGWPDEATCVLDADVGLSGASAEDRPGFTELVSRVSLGQAGIVFAYDATRLARNCSDWYPLLDLCGFRNCLIGDADFIYDPGSINGRLLLGPKGPISELELHTLRSRLNAGLMNKAKRGELVIDLPIGFIKGEAAGDIEKFPDREVQSRIDLVFQKFLRLKSLGKVVRYMNQYQLLLPRRIRGGGVRWREPTLSAISSMLRNPTYSGAYAYGKTRFVPQDNAPHKRRKQRIAQDQWKVLIQDHHPGYVSWEEFMKIQQILENNHAEYGRKKSSGAARSGAALLQGIVYCGRCGHQMTTQYRRTPQYTCNYLHQQRRLGICAVVRGDTIDQKIEEMFWRARNTDELNLLEQAQAEQLQEVEQLQAAGQLQLQRLRHQADLAERRNQHCDPGNRLVAAELEQRREESLTALRQAETQLQRTPARAIPQQLTPQQRLAWEQAGASLRDLWSDGRLSQQQKKQVLRTLIEKVVVRIDEPGQATVRLVWRGGCVEQETVFLNVGGLTLLPECAELERRICEMSAAGSTDEWIAYQLSQDGFRQSHLPYVSIGLVGRVRSRTKILCKPARQDLPDGCLTMTQT